MIDPSLEKQNFEKNQDSSKQWIKDQLKKIPSKLSFRIGEVSQIIGVKPYILRYWESEFDQLKPLKLDNKQRLYFHKDIETLFLIKKLLYGQGYSIRGAKQALKSTNKEFKQFKKDYKGGERTLQELENLMKNLLHLKSFFCK